MSAGSTEHQWTIKKAEIFLEEMKPLSDKYEIKLEIAPDSGVLRNGYSDHDLDLTFCHADKQILDFWDDKEFWDEIGYFDLIKNRVKDVNKVYHDNRKDVRGFFGELERKGMKIIFEDWIKKHGSHATIILTDKRIELHPKPKMTDPVNAEDKRSVSS